MPLSVATRTPGVIRAVKNDASLALAATGAGTWVDADASGNASARNLDLVFPSVKAGDVIACGVKSEVTPGGTNGIFFDFCTVVAGVATNRFAGNAASGQTDWTAITTLGISNIGPLAWYTVQAADLSNVVNGYGSVRCRLQYQKTAGTAGSMVGGSGNKIEVVGLGPF